MTAYLQCYNCHTALATFKLKVLLQYAWLYIFSKFKAVKNFSSHQSPCALNGEFTFNVQLGFAYVAEILWLLTWKTCIRALQTWMHTVYYSSCRMQGLAQWTSQVLIDSAAERSQCFVFSSWLRFERRNNKRELTELELTTPTTNRVPSQKHSAVIQGQHWQISDTGFCNNSGKSMW